MLSAAWIAGVYADGAAPASPPAQPEDPTIEAQAAWSAKTATVFGMDEISEVQPLQEVLYEANAPRHT
jgi:hypothetical protein